LIYALVHPDTLEVRYVGKTTDLAGRAARHAYSAGHQERRHLPVYAWWREVVQQTGHAPSTVHIGPGDAVEERALIQTLRTKGARLLNKRVGGCGGPLTPEARAKISRSRIGIHIGPEHRASVARSNRTRYNAPRSAESRARSSAALLAYYAGRI